MGGGEQRWHFIINNNKFLFIQFNVAYLTGKLNGYNYFESIIAHVEKRTATGIVCSQSIISLGDL